MASLVRRGASALRSSPLSPRLSLQAFATSSSQQRLSTVPALADVLPDGGPVFDAKQRQFREKLLAAQKQKEQQESQCILHSSPSAPAAHRPCPCRGPVKRQKLTPLATV